jgi:hypothetical protein
MLDRSTVGALALAAALGVAAGGAGAQAPTQAPAAAKYPDWKGQWTRIGGVQWDPSKPRERQQEPLTAEYEAIYQANLVEQKYGGVGGNPTFTCLPAGMPRVMTLVEPMEIIVTPEVTYVRIEYGSTFRRIYTDGRDWPQTLPPTFAGYSIGKWDDPDGAGMHHALSVETRGLKGPRSFDSTGMPLHPDNATVITERIYLDKDKADVLHDQITTDDHALTAPWAVTKSYQRSRQARWIEAVCAEQNQYVVIGKENYFVSLDGLLMPTRKDQPPPDLKLFDRAP